MIESSHSDCTHQLQQLMQQVGVSSFKALSDKAGVSKRQVKRLRRGEVAQMRVADLLKLSQVLQVSVSQLLAAFADVGGLRGDPPQPPLKRGENEEFRAGLNRGENQGFQAALNRGENQGFQAGLNREENQRLISEVAALRQEYQRLQTQMQQQRETLMQEFQQSSLQVLESLLLQLPTAAFAAQQNDQLPAVRLLPLLRPLEQLIQTWGVEAIAAVGAEIPYNPQWHQLMEGTAQPGDRVKVRYTGYRQGEKLLYRAKVSSL